jgi:hypothetical protein
LAISALTTRSKQKEKKEQFKNMQMQGAIERARLWHMSDHSQIAIAFACSGPARRMRLVHRT